LFYWPKSKGQLLRIFAAEAFHPLDGADGFATISDPDRFARFGFFDK
jgi:hypothetical protein